MINISCVGDAVVKYNIALFGTFNVENYGDLMFPVIFKRAMEKRGLDFNLVLFSPEKTCAKALDDSTMVYAAEEIEAMHNQRPFDAIVVGGGALVHYNQIAVKFPDSDNVVPYDITESWFYPVEFAARKNIKLIFNLPQIPYPFSKPFKNISQAAFDSCEYISFRDEISKTYLSDIYDDNPPDIKVFPDAVCCISDLIDSIELSKIKENILGFDKKYAVIQFNPQKPEADDEYLLKIIEKLKNSNLTVVLLPIGYTHNDDSILDDFNKKYNANCTIIKKKLNIIETAAVLSDCEIYIGSSFHGAITAIAYGKKAISYNYIYPKNKNQEIFRMYNVSNFVVENAKDAYTILENLLDNKIGFVPKLDEVQKQVDLHFDNIYSLITNADNTKKRNYDQFRRSFVKILPEIALLEQENKRLLNSLNSQTEYSNKLESTVSEYIAEAKKCQKYISDLERNNKEQNEYIKNLESALNSTQENLNSLQLDYARIRNNFFVRVLLFIKRILTKK